MRHVWVEWLNRKWSYVKGMFLVLYSDVNIIIILNNFEVAMKIKGWGQSFMKKKKVTDKVKDYGLDPGNSMRILCFESSMVIWRVKLKQIVNRRRISEIIYPLEMWQRRKGGKTCFGL